MTDQPRDRDEAPFFVGYLPIPLGLRRFLPVVALALICGFIGLGFAVSATQDDPGDGSFRWDWRAQTVTGVLQAEPYPVLNVTEDGPHVRAGQALMLSGAGKFGVQGRAAASDGQLVELRGVLLTRGDLTMMQLGGRGGLMEVGEAPALNPPEDLGRWRLTGEICDGKCYGGAMRPGSGLAHKACANLCLIGGTPPVWVATGAVEGRRYFLIAGPDGRPLPVETYLDHVALLREAEGQVMRQGDLMIFRMDPETLGAPR